MLIDPSLPDHPAFAEPLTKEDWRAYVDFEAPDPPQMPDFAGYQQLSEADREDLNDLRDDYHSALVLVETPPLLALHQKMRVTVRMNRRPLGGARHGHVLDGPRGTLGKSTILKTFGREHELYLRRRRPELFTVPNRDFTPVVYISVPDGATPKQLSERFADYLGLPVRSRASRTEITGSVLKALNRCGTQV